MSIHGQLARDRLRISFLREGEFMKAQTQLFGVAVVMLAIVGDLVASESIGVGKIKSVDLKKRDFVFTDEMGKDRTVKYDEDTVINRGGRDGQSDLKANDSVCIYYETSGLSWRANYILVQEGESKNWSLAHGTVKSRDSDKKEITYIDDKGRSWTYSTANVSVFINRAEAKVESIKIGERVMTLLQKAGDQTMLKSLYVTRK